MRDKIYYVGIALSLISLCCKFSAASVVLLIVGFSMVLTGYIR